MPVKEAFPPALSEDHPGGHKHTLIMPPPISGAQQLQVARKPRHLLCCLCYIKGPAWEVQSLPYSKFSMFLASIVMTTLTAPQLACLFQCLPSTIYLTVPNCTSNDCASALAFIPPENLQMYIRSEGLKPWILVFSFSRGNTLSSGSQP